MRWWSTWVSGCMTVLFVASVAWGVVDGAMSLAVWCMIGFITAGSLSLLVSYVFMPIARPIVQKHVILLATSYMLFSLTPLLHGVGLWPHDESADRLWNHFGVPGFCLLTMACVTGFIGLILAAQSIEERLRNIPGMGATENKEVM